MSLKENEIFEESKKEAEEEQNILNEESRKAREDYIEKLDISIHEDLFKVFALIRESEKKLIELKNK